MHTVGRPFTCIHFTKKVKYYNVDLILRLIFADLADTMVFPKSSKKAGSDLLCVKTETQAKALQWEHNVFGVATSYFTFLGFNLWIVFTFSKTRFQITRLNGLSTIHLKRINHESYLAPFFSRFEPKWKSYWFQEIFNYWRIVHKTISNYCHHSIFR